MKGETFDEKGVNILVKGVDDNLVGVHVGSQGIVEIPVLCSTI